MLRAIRNWLVRCLPEDNNYNVTHYNELTLNKKAELAAQLKENPLFDFIIKEIEYEIIEAWKNSPARDTQGREYLFMRIEAVRKIGFVMDGYINTALYEHKIKGQGDNSLPE